MQGAQDGRWPEHYVSTRTGNKRGTHQWLRVEGRYMTYSNLFSAAGIACERFGPADSALNFEDSLL